MTEPRITMAHVRRLRRRGTTCTPGIREWCDAHSFDLRKFVQDGVAGEEALRIGDPFTLALLEIARSEGGTGGR